MQISPQPQHQTDYLYQKVGDRIGLVEYVDHMGTDLTIVNAARVSFGKHKKVIDGKDEKLINYLIKHRHTSTLEHNVITFRFKVPLFVRSQHHRHRTWSYNEISRRYTDSRIEFYQPTSLRSQNKSNRQGSNSDQINPLLSYQHPEAADLSEITATEKIKTHHRESLILYDQLLDSGVCREQARGILPQNLYTEYYGTCNLNNLIKFVKLRTHDGAQWEIQKVAQKCMKIANQLWPIAVGSLIKNHQTTPN